MAIERTLSIIKPDAVENHKAGAIIAQLEGEGFVIKAMKRIHLTRAEAEASTPSTRGEASSTSSSPSCRAARSS